MDTKFEFKGHAGKWYLQEFTDRYTNIIRCNAGPQRETLFLFSTPQDPDAKIRYDAKLASKSLEMFEMLQKVIKINNFHQFNGHLINDQIEELLKEATTL